MANFNLLKPILLRNEGGFVNHPADKGGPTNKGITFATWKTYCKRKLKVATVESLRAMTDAEWTEIIKTMYWDKCLADHINDQNIANLLVDWYVNSGTVATRHIQRLVDVTADGIIGPRSLNAINSAPALSLFWRLHQDRIDFYRHRAKTKPSQAVFLQGWLNRVNAFTYEFY